MKPIVILLLCLFGSVCAGQTTVPVIKAPAPATKQPFRLLARYEGDSVTLRWFPPDPLTWKAAGQVGYLIVRYGLNIETNQLADSVVLTQRPLKPLTANDWVTRFPASDTVARAFGQLAAEELSKPITNLGEALNRKEQADQQYVFTMLYGSLYPAYLPLLALRFTDKTAAKNRAYIYELRPAPGRQMVPIDRASIVVRTNKLTERPAMPEVTARPADGVVQFSWNRQAGNYWFMAYQYERSADGGKTFVRVRKRPYIDGNRDSTSIMLTDTLPRNYVSYQYRIAGVTAFGDLGQFSPPITVMGRDLTPPTMPTDLKAVNTTGSAVNLTWTKTTKEGDLAGFIVSKSAEQTGPFVPMNASLLLPGTRQFTDPSGNQYAKNFYIVSAVDTAGNAVASLAAYVAMKDRSAPNAPTGLAGRIDSAGVFLINWAKNTEPDLMGYLVYAANAPDHAFMPLTPDFLTTETFQDTTSLRTLTKNLYIKVIAFDKSRRASQESAVLVLKRPDIVPPTSPVFNDFSVADSSATLKWVPSSSEDVITQILYRQEEGQDATPVEVARFDNRQTAYTDKTVLPRHWYAYTLVAMDDSKLRSETSFPQRVRPYFSGVRAGIKNLTSMLSTDGKQIQLQWKVPSTSSGRVLVYRKINDQPLRLIENLPGSQQTYQDGSTQKGTYQYALKTVYADGGESPLSAFVRLER